MIFAFCFLSIKYLILGCKLWNLSKSFSSCLNIRNQSSRNRLKLVSNYNLNVRLNSASDFSYIYSLYMSKQVLHRLALILSPWQCLQFEGNIYH